MIERTLGRRSEDMAPPTEAVFSHREYLDLLQERNRLMRRLKEKEKTQAQRENEERERGFNLYARA